MFNDKVPHLFRIPRIYIYIIYIYICIQYIYIVYMYTHTHISCILLELKAPYTSSVRPHALVA